MSRTIIIWVVVGIAVVGGFLAILVYAMTRSRYIYIGIAENVGVSQEWTEVHFERPLTGKRQVQKIALVMPGARRSEERRETFLPDGTIIEAEVELKAQGGDWIRLRSGSGTVSVFDPTDKTWAVGSTDFTLPSDGGASGSACTSVRLRGRNAFTCSKIRWVDFYMK